MSLWSYYDTTTGLFTGAVISASEEAMIANTPAGCSAIEGEYDALAQKVDTAGGVVTDYIPDAPADTALITYAWDTATKRWVGTPTLAANKLARKVPIQAEIDAIEQNDSHARSVREILLAVVASETPPSESVTVLSDAEAEIQAMRDVMDAIDAAVDQAALDGIIWP